MASPVRLDPGTLEIKTRSIERTLLPLVQQITTLVSVKERAILGASGRTRRALARVGQAVNVAVERFVTVGEAIADDNVDVRSDMYNACQEARQAGSAIEKLCGGNGVSVSLEEDVTHCAASERSAMVRSARCLLASVTRVLLLADTVVVKQLLLAKDRVSQSLGSLESVGNFTEFVKAFAQFGQEMVELAQLSGERQSDLKDERRRAQMAAARQVLERSTMMLLTSSKTCLRHPECPFARQTRYTVFCQMRRAMDLVHFVVKDGVLDAHAALLADAGDATDAQEQQTNEEEWDAKVSVTGALRRFEEYCGAARVTQATGAAQRQRLSSSLDMLVERTQDFTDSAYTTHEHRENLLLLCDRAKLQLNQLLRVAVALEQREIQTAGCTELEAAVSATLAATTDLRAELQQTALEQAQEMLGLSPHEGSFPLVPPPSSPSNPGTNSVSTNAHPTTSQQWGRLEEELAAALRNAALAADEERLEEAGERFKERIEQAHEICKLLGHIAPEASLQVAAKHAEVNLQIYGPQTVTAAHSLLAHPNSKIAKENFEVFVEMWQALMSDVMTIARDVSDRCRQQLPERQMYMSLPRPGKHGTTGKPLKAGKLDPEEQAKIAKSGLEMQLLTSEMEAETDRWTSEGSANPVVVSDSESGVVVNTGPVPSAASDAAEATAAALSNMTGDENNDIVRRTKNLSAMAFSMYQFTRGEGTLKTTQDLFTQAEYFAEEANRLYKVVRQFSYQVPSGPHKKELLELLDKIPTYVQQLQMAVKCSTVGKAATFTKVDAVIQQTKELMGIISKVVTTCFTCASKYALLMPAIVEVDGDDWTSNQASSSSSAQQMATLRKYNLDFRGLSPRGTTASPFEEGNTGATGSEGGKGSGGTGSDASM